MKFVISNHHARGDFLKRVAKVCKCRARSRICAVSCPLGDTANFVVFNWPLRGTICLAEQ